MFPNFVIKQSGIEVNNLICLVLDDDYSQGVGTNLAYEMMKKTGKKIEAIGLKNRSAGFSKTTDNLPPNYLEIVEKAKEVMKV